ncbi:MAG TPA: zinc-dependent metalloprotease [Chitinophagaceae bacterium]|nr:zinc-dependent metalloprotease [Chitinophagaceae bacterium]
MKNFLRYKLGLLALVATITTSAQVPVLSSNPSASAVIFLDFDGQSVTGTSWNYSGPIFCGASGLDSTKIVTIFNRVSEDYRPFNVNITTDSTKYFAAPANKRMRVILTVTYEWYGSAGGVAFVGSFIWGDNTPCFIFTSLLGYNVKNIAEAAAHEVGHTLGLYHQSTYDTNCVKVSDYNYGQGTGEIGWAPIMGVGYYQNLTLWNNGPNSFGCTNYQNDLDVITTYSGLGYRTDDYSGSFASASNVNFAANQFTVNGIIEMNSDQDIIKFTQPGIGNFRLDAVPYNVGTGNSGSDLDMQVTLYNSSQIALGVYNPGTLLSSVIDTLLDPGTYYLRIEGKGNMYAPNYASLGSYALTGTFTAGNPLPLRRLELTGQINGDRHILNWIIDADEQVVEQVLDYSTDGRNFSPVITPAVNDRSFDYQPYSSGAVQYRLRVKFDNGKQYVSNIVTLRNNIGPKPQLLGNLIAGNSIVISSPGNYDYSIFDINGKITSKGKLTNGINNIMAPFAAGGMYLIRYSNGAEQWTDKIVRQ